MDARRADVFINAGETGHLAPSWDFSAVGAAGAAGAVGAVGAVGAAGAAGAVGAVETSVVVSVLRGVLWMRFSKQFGDPIKSAVAPVIKLFT